MLGSTIGYQPVQSGCGFTLLPIPKIPNLAEP